MQGLGGKAPSPLRLIVKLPLLGTPLQFCWQLALPAYW
jgi:hypothetical protein